MNYNNNNINYYFLSKYLDEKVGKEYNDYFICPNEIYLPE